MPDTYTWNIVTLERHLDDGAVYTAHWTLGAERINGQKTYLASCYGSLGFSAPDPTNFIPYDELTPEIVIGWVQSVLGADKVTDMKKSLSNQLDSQETPVDASGVPW